MSGSEGAQRAPGPVRGKRCRGRKTTEATEPSAPAAKAQKVVNSDFAQQSATPWRDVGKIPDDRQTIQALIAKVEQLKKLIQNNQAQSNSQHDNCRQHRMESSPQTEQMLRYSKRQNLVVFGIAESSACICSSYRCAVL
ncbi:TPA: hypothetical protein ACH3X1_013647 [Trebouxia sp. C0004]